MKKITRFMVCVLSLVFAWGVGGICFADNAAEVVIQVSYPAGDDYVAFYNGVVGDIDTTKKDHYVNVHITLLDANGEPATAGPTGEAWATPVTVTLATDLGVASSIEKDMFLTDSAVLSFDIINVGPAARAHVKYACQTSCEPGTDTLTATVTGLDPATAEVEVRAPKAAALVVRTAGVTTPDELFEAIPAQYKNNNNAITAGASPGADIGFEVYAVETSAAGDFTTAPELDGQTVTVSAYADYTANNVIGNPPYEDTPVATATAVFSDGVATGTITMEKGGVIDGDGNQQLKIVFTATTGSGGVGTTQIDSDPATTDATLDWVGVKYGTAAQLIIGKDPIGTGNYILEVDTWYVLDDNNTAYGPTTNAMAVFLADQYGNPVTGVTVDVKASLSGPLMDQSKTLLDSSGVLTSTPTVHAAWKINKAVRSVDASDGLATLASTVGQSNEQEATGGGTGGRGKPLEATLALEASGLSLDSDTATVWLVRWDSAAPLELDLHLDNDKATTTMIAGETVTLYITSASGSEDNPTTSEIVEYNDDLTIDAYECTGLNKALLISKSTSGFDQATDAGLELKAVIETGEVHVEIPIKVYGEVTKGQERSVCFKISDSNKGLEDITLYQASRNVELLYAAAEDNVKISSLATGVAAENDDLEADPIVITSEMLVGENSLLPPSSAGSGVNTADEYGNIVDGTPDYYIDSDIGMAGNDSTKAATVLYDADDVGETDTIIISIPGVGTRELQITNIAATAASAGQMVCVVEGPIPATPGGEAIVQLKASPTTFSPTPKPIIVVIDEANSVTDSELRDFSGISQGTDATGSLDSGSMVRVVVSAPEAGIVTLEVGDTSGGTSALDTGACTVLFAVDTEAATASIAVNNATDPGTAEIEITVEDDYAVALGSTTYTIETGGSDITSTLTCTTDGEGTTEGTITCAKSGGGLDEGSYDVEVTPQDMAGNVGTTVSGTYMVSTCTPVVTIDPSSASVSHNGGTQQFTATTDCNGDVTSSAAYTWEISVRCATGSSIDATGLYTAGTATANCTETIQVTDTVHSGSATADVTVLVCEPEVSISPSISSIVVGETQTFTASTDCSSATPVYSWTAEGGTLDTSSGSSVVYTATTAGSGSVTATDTPNKSASATVSFTVEPDVTMEVTPATLLRSRWIPLPAIMFITGDGTSFAAFSSTVTYSPATSVLALPPLVWGAESIWQTIFVSPSWLAGGTEAETLTVTVTTGSETVTDTVAIEMLPFILDEQ